MDKIKKTKIMNLNIESNHRIFFMSDIHSDYNLLDHILNDLNFNDDDYLFIIGDLYEKGPMGSNLEALRYYITLANNKNVFLLAGNCDEVLRFLLPPVNKEYFLSYALKKKKSIINDIAKELNYTLSYDMNVDDFCSLVYKEYKELFDFIDTLNDIIYLNNKIVLVHGGIFDFNNIPAESLNVLKVDEFYNRIDKSPIIQIVGHYPTRNYRDDITSLNPIIDFSKNVICIDGGNQVADGGQINVLLLDDINTLDFYFKSYNHYKKFIFNDTKDYEIPLQPFSIFYGNNEIKILEEKEDFYLIEELSSKSRLYVLKEDVYFNNNKYYCYDGSNIFISFRKGDIASLVKKRQPFSLINYDGIIGLVDTRYIPDDI